MWVVLSQASSAYGSKVAGLLNAAMSFSSALVFSTLLFYPLGREWCRFLLVVARTQGALPVGSFALFSSILLAAYRSRPST